MNPGTLAGCQDRCNRPLCQASAAVESPIVSPAEAVFVPHCGPMSKLEIACEAFEVCDALVAASGLRQRPGQRLMAELTFSLADLGRPPEDEDGPIEALEP